VININFIFLQQIGNIWSSITDLILNFVAIYVIIQFLDFA